MTKDITKLCFLPGSLLPIKDGKYLYISLLKQGLANLGITYPSATFALPLVQSSGVVSMPQADAVNDGYLSAADYAAFSGTVSWTLSGSNIYNSNIGNVGIGGAPSGTHKFEVVGGAKFSSNVEVNSMKIWKGNSNSVGNVFIGENNYPLLLSTNQTVAIGHNIFSTASAGLTGIYGNTVIGFEAAKAVNANSTFDNVVIGTFASWSSTGGFQATVAIGKLALRYNTGIGNVGIGRHVGTGVTTGNYNILIGYNAEVPVGTADSQLSIGNWIYGKSGRISIGISAPADCAIFDLTSTTKGFLLPRMTKAQRDLIGTPIAGLAIYQTDNTPGLRVYNGTNWVRFTETID